MATKKTTSSTKTAHAAKATAKKPAVKTAAVKKPAAQATAKKPAAKTAAAKKPVAKAASAKKPAAKKPAAKKPADKKPAAKKAVSAAARSTTASRKPASKKPAPAQETATKPAPKRPSRKASSFSIGDKVVHPQHGAAIIAKKVKQTVAGQRQDYFKLEIATDQLTVFVPIASIEDTIRPVISKNQARKVFSLFKETPQEAGSNWSRWYKVLNEKMTSGDIYQVAEVVRDLSYAQQTKGISPALKRMLSKARLTLTSELRFALNVDEEEATRKLDRALPKVDIPYES